jgi:hypothetical protein
MPKSMFPAAGGALTAASPTDLLDIQDELCRTRHGVQAAHMAALEARRRAPKAGNREEQGGRLRR